jgi:hypothetical protein
LEFSGEQTPNKGIAKDGFLAHGWEDNKEKGGMALGNLLVLLLFFRSSFF